MLIQLVILSCCLYCTWTDLRDRRIPNRAILLGFFAISLLHLLAGGSWYLLTFLAVALLVLLALGLASLLWPAAIGMGDVKLLALLCFALGLRPFAAVIMLASLCALLGAIWLLVQKRARPGVALPFAPFLTAGLLLFWLLAGLDGSFPQS
ncbi:prepilin peptidase [Brevibacillus sp. TJ4]|uniref:prepilin peptidase n=1 Tax=Brevibacillus sp. TJ4 TaxID=3234853 RepID=UPI003BA3DA86